MGYPVCCRRQAVTHRIQLKLFGLSLLRLEKATGSAFRQGIRHPRLMPSAVIGGCAMVML
jgi:hypothetical protein